MPRPLVARLVGVLATCAALGACRHASPDVADARTLVPGAAIGDSASITVRIAEADARTARVRFALSRPAYVRVLSIVPGHSIEPVDAFDARGTPPGVGAGLHTLVLRQSGGPRPSSGVAESEYTIASRQEYDRCVRAVNDRYDPPAPKRPVRDSSGKVVSSEPDPSAANRAPRTGLAQAEAGCRRNLVRAQTERRPGAAAAEAPKGRERYLVVVASEQPLGTIEMLERINALTVKADDARSTIVGVVEGLYADRGGKWSGYYVKW
jgi:hypothetical protein